MAAFVVHRILTVAFLAGGAIGAVAALALTAASSAPAPIAADLAKLLDSFRRPATVPFPADDPFSEKKRALGEALFNDRRLSIDQSRSCASCHDRAKGFADGEPQGRGVPGRPLKRHTPTIWNLAWAGPVFWDGRARSLEEQAAGPIENPDEMAQPMASVIARLSVDPAMRRAFAEAFPGAPKVDAGNLAKAIATYERTLISPPTRFDRLVAGDSTALSERELAGFRLFAGKAGCANCHKGWAFTDHNFYDIGLPGDDRGRGAVLRLAAAEHAFKTPGLRELGRSGPYMHDGSLASLDDVVRHYAGGVVDRPTVAKDIPRRLTLSEQERADLVAFLGTLTSDSDPLPPATITAGKTGPNAPAAHVSTITQDDKAFSPVHVAIKRGGRLWILNNDTRTHNVRVFSPEVKFDSGAQEPGETVEIPFPKAGTFLVFCGIHPKMELYVDVGR
jgi:cytochrome c peroxidase